MSFNADNLFLNLNENDQLLEAISSVFQEKKWKVAVSTPTAGWVQLIESHENTPPEFACSLSKKLDCVVVCAQLYETAGECAWHISSDGTTIESIHNEFPEDPDSEIHDALKRNHIPFKMRLFREVVSQTNVWSILQKR
jgi:hypothetical protein